MPAIPEVPTVKKTAPSAPLPKTVSNGASNPVVRALVAADLPGLLAVQLACYGAGFVESAEVFARRLASAINCSLVLERDGVVCAYLAAYRSWRGKVTPLHGDFGPNERDGLIAPDTLYLHDLAVLPSCAGQGLSQTLLQPLWAEASERGLRHSALVSVQGSQAYWARQGYAEQALVCNAQRAHLASYGDGAMYMVRELQK
ncbi:MAG: GNAT family N-acetyltransferase [Burkholderiaceae bacterium]|nr:GNAT family N-acetyltransferase [Burkholderiaceae bacterium]